MKNPLPSSLILMAVAYTSPVSAQVSIQTFGTTDAKTCAQNAFAKSTNLTACNKALKDANTTRDDRIKTLINRGNSWYLAGRYPQALEDYFKALELQTPKRTAVWYNIGLTYKAMKKDDKAREAFEISLSFNPDFQPAKDKLAGYQ